MKLTKACLCVSLEVLISVLSSTTFSKGQSEGQLGRLSFRA